MNYSMNLELIVAECRHGGHYIMGSQCDIHVCYVHVCYVHVCMYVCMYVCTSMYSKHVHVFTSMYMYMYLQACICTCTSATGLQLKYMSYALVYVPYCHVHKDNDKGGIYSTEKTCKTTRD